MDVPGRAATVGAMTSTALQNLFVALVVIAGLALTCRVAYRVAGGLLDAAPKPQQSAPVEESGRLAA